MYNDTIKVANKIITSEDLMEIFEIMNEKLVYYKKINDREELNNRMLDYRYQNWTFKDSSSKIKFEVDFYDNTNIKMDNYNNFITIFNNRLEEIKRIQVYFYLTYETRLEGQKSEFYSQHIFLSISENNMDIDLSLNSNDTKLNDVYELIKSKVLNAKPKYDEIIKKRSLIKTTIGLSLGFIPALVLSTILIFVPTIREIYSQSYVVYPIASLIFAFLIGNIIGSFKLDRYYKYIIPEQKYVGYDSSNNRMIYKDDVDKFISTSEILIGKNANNLKCREQIKQYKEKYKKWLPYEFGVLIIISIIVLFLG